MLLKTVFKVFKAHLQSCRQILAIISTMSRLKEVGRDRREKEINGS